MNISIKPVHRVDISLVDLFMTRVINSLPEQNFIYAEHVVEREQF